MTATSPRSARGQPCGFLLETRMPGGLDLLNPLRLKGAYEMAFDLIFMLRDRAPGTLELAASIGVVAGVSAMLTLGVSALYRHVYGTAALVLMAALAGGPRPRRVSSYVSTKTPRSPPPRSLRSRCS